MPAYRISTNTVRPLEDAPRGSYEWLPFEDDKNVLTVTITSAADLRAKIAAAVLVHFDLFPDATACKPFADKLRGERHVSGGKAACNASMVLRETVSA
jgi:hypothetical protein